MKTTSSGDDGVAKAREMERQAVNGALSRLLNGICIFAAVTFTVLFVLSVIGRIPIR